MSPSSKNRPPFLPAGMFLQHIKSCMNLSSFSAKSKILGDCEGDEYFARMCLLVSFTFVAWRLNPLLKPKPYRSASKTALAKAYQEMGSNGTIVLLYTLAPPLLEHACGDHYDLEQMALVEYGEKGPRFRNWINGTSTLAGLDSDKNAVVLSFSLGFHDNLHDWSPYLYLSAATGGELYRTNYLSVSRLTICLLLTWMQADGDIDIPQAIRTTYKGDPTLFHWACEANMEVFCGLNRGNLEVFDTHTAPPNRLRVPYGGVSNNNQQLNSFTSENLAKTYTDSSIWYKDVIARHISRMIRTNVSVLAIHPLFQRLWVTVCMDRTGSRIKRTLKQRSEAEVLRISDDEDKRQAEAWLDEADTILHEIDEEISMPADFKLGDNIPPEETKWSGYCFDENSIVKSLCTNPGCVIKMCTECANDWSSLCIYCNSPLLFPDMPTN